MRPTKATDHVEVERLRAVAATEISHVEVKPIRTDFHFFVQTHKEKYLKEANKEVRKSSKTPEGEKLDVFLVNTNLNTRLMKAWEDLTKEERDEYMVMEEEDRRRFMEEDEIASRHCATLTARGKSPRASDKSKKEEQREESETHLANSPDRESPNRKGGLPKDEDDEGNDEEDDEEGDESDGEDRPDGALDDESATREVESPKKRMSPPTKVDTSSGAESTNESPSKRNRGTLDV